MLTWSIQVQLLLQIVINRIRIILADRHKGRMLMVVTAILVTLINISVFCIWMPARLQISNRSVVRQCHSSHFPDQLKVDSHQQHLGPYRKGSVLVHRWLPQLLLHARGQGQPRQERTGKVQQAGIVQPTHDCYLSTHGYYDHRGDVDS